MNRTVINQRIVQTFCPRTAKRILLIWWVFTAIFSALPAQAALNVENSQASQRPGSEFRGGSRYVDIYYDAIGTTAALTVSVLISNDDGATWNVGPTTGTLSGDIGQGVSPGVGKHIVWDAGTDRPNVFWEKTKARVIATEEDGGAAEIIVNLPGGVPMVLVKIPAGAFTQGSPENEQDRWQGPFSGSDEGPQHEVTLTNDFYMGKYVVTQAQWTAVMGTTPWLGQDYVLDAPDSPAIYVSWDDISGSSGFLENLNAHLTSTGQVPATCRLPSESEWEYACRAGTTTRFYWGDDPTYTEINVYAWWVENAWDAGERYAHIVGTKLPNAFGLYDMSGNVWEWCQDRWHNNYDGAPNDGSVWESDTGYGCVLRGDCWNNYGWSHRSASRAHSYTDNRGYPFGFRIVRTQP